MTWPTIDHGSLSPSGRASERSRAAAQKRAAAELFPPGFWDARPPAPPEAAADRARQSRALAAKLRDLAARGMRPRAHAKEAARLEAEADRLERAGDLIDGRGLTKRTRTNQEDATP